MDMKTVDHFQLLKDISRTREFGEYQQQLDVSVLEKKTRRIYYTLC